jgi:hypothetical protein
MATHDVYKFLTHYSSLLIKYELQYELDRAANYSAAAGPAQAISPPHRRLQNHLTRILCIVHRPSRNHTSTGNASVPEIANTDAAKAKDARFADELLQRLRALPLTIRQSR